MDVELEQRKSPANRNHLRDAVQEALQLAREVEALVARAAAAPGLASSHPVRLARAHALSLMDELGRILSA